VRRPVARAPELVLHRAGGGDDRALRVGGDVVARMLVVERDLATAVRVADVSTVALPASSVVLVPGVVDRGLVLVVVRGKVVGALPDGVVVVELELGLLAGGVPVTGTAHGGVVAARDAHGVRLLDGLHRGDGGPGIHAPASRRGLPDDGVGGGGRE